MQKLMEAPLYDKILLDTEGSNTLYYYLNNQGFDKMSIDLYCPCCKQISTFNPSDEGQMKYKYRVISTMPELLFIRTLSAKTPYKTAG